MGKRLSWDEISKTATSDEGMGAKTRFYFHCFNPNGAYAALRAAQAAVAQWCEDHPERPNGVLFVCRSLNTHPEKMCDAARKAIKDRRNVAWNCNYAVSIMKRDTEKALEFLADESQWPAPKETTE